MGSHALLDTNTEVVLHNAVSSLAFPTGASDGASIAATERDLTTSNTPGAWHRNERGGATVDAAIFVETSGAQTFSGGLGLYGYRSSTSKWYLLGQLNGGSAIATLGANTGYSTTVQLVGLFDRLAVGPLTAAAVTPGGGTTTTIRACQVRVRESVKL